MKTLLSGLSDRTYNKLLNRAAGLFQQGVCCPRQCGGDGDLSRSCGALERDIGVASFAVHTGEEPPVSGDNGAGNVFFTGCSLGCEYCQNWPVSHRLNGGVYNPDDFAGRILALQKRGVHNINLTTGDQYVSHVLRALRHVRKEINIPLLFNCSGYILPELLEIALSFCDGMLFDVKYARTEPAARYSHAGDYPDVVRSALELLCEKGPAWNEQNGILRSGLIIRHLVLPGQVDNSCDVIRMLQEYREAGLAMKISLMSQYFPAHRADSLPPMNRKILPEEYAAVRDLVASFDMDGWFQDI